MSDGRNVSDRETGDGERGARGRTGRRTVLRGLGASALGTAFAGTASADGAQPATGEVTLVHDTHFHGRYGDLEEPENIVNYFGLMNGIARRRRNALLVGNGDDLGSSVLSSAFEGRHIVDAFDAGGLRYDTFGNHDFDYGPLALRRMIRLGRTRWVSANVRDDRTGDVFGRLQGAQRFAVERVGGVSVGLTGLITPEAPDITSLGDHTVVLDPAEALREVGPQMREAGADVVVVLSHLAGPVAERVAGEVSGVDAVVGDHAASVLEEPRVVDGTVLSFVGDEFDYVGELTLRVEDGEAADFEFTLHETARAVEESGFRPSRPVQAVAERYLSELDERLDVVVGRTTVPLDARREVVRSRESNLGNFISDAMMAEVDADAALMNGGGIRSDTLYEPGELTKRQIVDILPFPNNVVELEVTGETLLAALENGVSRVDERSGRFPQVGGMRYVYDPDRPVGERVVEASVGGSPIEPDATYALATNDFVSTGGDGYEMLTDATVLLPGNEGPLLSDLVISVIEERGTISPETEGRIEVAGDSG